MTNTCFVVMPIGTQIWGEKTITEDELRKKYDYIIKNAILQADSTLDVIRADEELNPGSMSNDIFTKLMYSKYVIADITYPNPNVFYELGIRHAISSRTILIRESTAQKVPFDISHLRYIEYKEDPGGMEKLAGDLKKRFDFYDSHPGKPDNQFLELCKFIDFSPEVYKSGKDTEKEAFSHFMALMFSKPDLFGAFMTGSKEEQSKAIIAAMKDDPSSFAPIAQAFLGGRTT